MKCYCEMPGLIAAVKRFGLLDIPYSIDREHGWRKGKLRHLFKPVFHVRNDPERRRVEAHGFSYREVSGDLIGEVTNLKIGAVLIPKGYLYTERKT